MGRRSPLAAAAPQCDGRSPLQYAQRGPHQTLTGTHTGTETPPPQAAGGAARGQTYRSADTPGRLPGTGGSPGRHRGSEISRSWGLRPRSPHASSDLRCFQPNGRHPPPGPSPSAARPAGPSHRPPTSRHCPQSPPGPHIPTHLPGAQAAEAEGRRARPRVRATVHVRILAEHVLCLVHDVLHLIDKRVPLSLQDEVVLHL